ncbi:MAG: hypothetical protein PVG93_01500 [Phycisphaerales bacterium]|jgi:hypothetical protein
MADFNLDEFNLDQTPQKNLDPIPFDDSDDGSSDNQVSHAPLDLGGGASPAPAAPKPAPAPAPAPAPTQAVSLGKTASAPAASEARITGVKIFFTKLHAGALDFLGEQITEWLKKNPGIVVKRTNAVVGEVASKKTEPNLVITVWY